MRIRKISALFWSTCILVFILILYVATDLSYKLPSIKPAMHDEAEQWTSFENKLRHIEKELNQHNAIVGEIKSAFDKVLNMNQFGSTEIKPHTETKAKEMQERRYNVVGDGVPKHKDIKAVGEESPKRSTGKFEEDTCPINYNGVSKPNIQMLSMYERINFEDKDGGAWKQGWNIEYNPDQWSSSNKLKVFIVPHSHNDPGWCKTFEEYFQSQTLLIFTNMVQKLSDNPSMKFIWAETSFLALWWSSMARKDQKAMMKKLLEDKQLEIVTGGWVMNDEANSHWLSVIQQLTTGHQWLLDNLNYIPKNAWAIDPFGHSSSQPYLLKLAGFKSSVIQRVHYRVKKELALNRQLEFRWRQLWDTTGATDMFTHMMPFFSYDVPHTCGPDPKVCCQFDFKRLPGMGTTCPWGVPPQKIVAKNEHDRSFMILDQWRKKTQLYRSNVLLVPLGDDFRYDRAIEWDYQYSNYAKLIDYINNNVEWNTEVQFGTLEDYFKALHKEILAENFPALTGDFFTYADRNQHYWSGYYTSRPFYKNMDRILLAYVRAAEIATAQVVARRVAANLATLQLRDLVEDARRALSLFQHHDGITGTSKDHVREDYAKKLLTAIKHSQSVIQQSAFYLLGQPKISEPNQEDVYFDVDDIWKKHDDIPSRITIALDAISPSRRIVLYNALAFNRTEILTVLVSWPHVEVYDPEGSLIMAQLSPVVTLREKELGIPNNKFQLSFLVTVGPLALATYIVSLRDSSIINKYTSYAQVRVYNADYWNVDLPNMFAVQQLQGSLEDDLALSNGETRIVCNKNGLLKSISVGGKAFPVHMDYVYYDSQTGNDNNSGAYLFLPSGPAQILKVNPYPTIVILESFLKTTIYSSIATQQTHITLAVTLKSNPTLPQSDVEISNTFIVDPVDNVDFEFAMRFSTNVRNGDVFYTDLNGMQGVLGAIQHIDNCGQKMIKRRFFDKIPLQANFYPLPAAAYIEDEFRRFTVLTSTPLGMAALAPGQIEIMQDRRLTKDDNRGVGQGVLDNIRTRHTFKLILENTISCASDTLFTDNIADFIFTTTTICKKDTRVEKNVYGALSLGAHVSSQMLLQPLVLLHYTAPANSPRPVFAPRLKSAADIVLASFRSHVSTKNKDGKTSHGMGMTFQRVYLDKCYGNKAISEWYPIGDGQVLISKYIDVLPEQLFESTLTHNRIKGPLLNGVLTLCPMEIRSIFINHTNKHD